MCDLWAAVPPGTGTCRSNPEGDVLGEQISPPGQEGWLRRKEKGRLPCWRRRGGRSTTEAKRSATRALTYLPPRRSRSKTIARVFPSCPGGEICSPILWDIRGQKIASAALPIAKKDLSL